MSAPNGGSVSVTTYVMADSRAVSTALIVKVEGEIKAVDRVRDVVQDAYVAALSRRRPTGAWRSAAPEPPRPIPPLTTDSVRISLTTGIKGLVEDVRREMSGTYVTIRDLNASTRATTVLVVPKPPGGW